jgi:hypothetical protein
MTPLQLICYAFMAGLTLCGFLGTVMELAAGRRLSFTEPFVSHSHILRSLGSTAAAGPFMLVNDALDAWRCGHVSVGVALSCGLTSAVWALATGVVMLELAARTAAFFS